MAFKLIDEFYCPNSSSNTNGTVKIFLDESNDIVASDSEVMYISSDCLKNWGYALNDVFYTYCNQVTGKEMEVRVTDTNPFGSVKSTGFACNACKEVISVNSLTHETQSGLSNGQAVINYNTALTNRSWILDGNTYIFPTTEGTFENLSAGGHTVTLLYGTGDCTASVSFTINKGASVHSVSLSKTNASKNGVCDGSITATVSGGTAPFTYLWNDGVTTKDRTGLCAGTYAITVTDANGAKASATTTIAEPTTEPVQGPGVFVVSPALGLRFLKDQTPANCEPVTLLKHFHNEYIRPGGYGKCYFQKFSQCDNLPLQVLSNYTSNKIDVMNISTGVTVRSITMQKVASFSNLSETYPGYIKAHSSGTRVYFNTQLFPVPIATGDSIELVYGVFTVQGIGKETNGAEYLIIGMAYTETSPTTAVSITTYFNKKDYDVWEGVVHWATIPEGMYGVYMRGTDSRGTSSYRSEGVNLREKHEGTVQLTYRHAKNKYDIYYASGFTNFTRFDGVMVQGSSSSEKTVHRQPNKLVTLWADYYPKYTLTTYALPNFMHNIIAMALTLDTCFADGLQVVNEEGYDQGEVLGSTGFSNGMAVLEVQNYANFMQGTGTLTEDDGTGDNGGDVDGGGLIESSENGFIKYN